MSHRTKLGITLAAVVVTTGLMLYNPWARKLNGSPVMNPPCNWRQQSVVTDYNPLSTEADIAVVMACDPVFNGWGCAGYKQTFVWKWNGSTWVLVASSGQTIVGLDCGDVNIPFRTSATMAAYGNPGDQMALTFKISTGLGAQVGFGQVFCNL